MEKYAVTAPSAQNPGRENVDLGLRDHMNRVYTLMSMGLMVTGLTAWIVASLAISGTETKHVMTNGTYLTDLGHAIFMTPWAFVIMVSPLAIVLLLGFGIMQISGRTATIVFHLFAALMGLSMSTIFAVYTTGSIVQTFLVTSAAFAGLSLFGYTTKRDLSAVGAFLIMGLFGLIIAMVVNIFVQSTALDLTLSVLGVLIFAGLTAYDTQKIKGEYLQLAGRGDESLRKVAVMSALTLYLDFVNLFLTLLRLLGNKR